MIRWKRLVLPVAVSLLILGATFYPWRSPEFDARLKGFDGNFLYVDLKGPEPNAGSVEIQSEEMTIGSVPHSQPTVILASSESSYEIEFDLTVLSDSLLGMPARLTVFFPFARQNASIEFRGANRSIVGYSLDEGNPLPRSFVSIGNYQLNQTAHLRADIRQGNSIIFEVYSDTLHTSYIVNREDAYSLLTADRRVTRFESRGGEQESFVRLTNLLISIPHAPFFAPKSNDPALPFAFLAIAAVILASNGKLLRSGFHRLSAQGRKLRCLPRGLWLLIIVSLVVQVALTPIGNHPHDIFSESIWIYTLMTGGLEQLYFRPLVTVAAAPFGGMPTQHAVYPYPPLQAYLYYGAGTILQALGVTSSESFGFEFLAKIIGIMGILVSGLLTYLIALQLSGTAKKSIAAAGAFLLNPAMIFDAAVWGATDSVLIMFLLAAMLFFLRKQPSLVWVSLSFALLTKQTAIVPSLVIGMLLLRSNGIELNLRGIASGLSAAFLAVGPFVIAGYSPLVMIGQSLFRVMQFALGSNSFPTSSPISADAYSLLPLFSLFSGLNGRDRMWYPDISSMPLLGLSYSQVGTILFGVATLPFVLWGIRKRFRDKMELAFLLVAVISLLSVYLPTRVSGRYFLVPLAFLVPVTFAPGSKLLKLSVWVMTLTTFISMYGLIAAWSFWFPGVLPNMEFARPVNLFVMTLYVDNTFMNVAILMNLAAIAGVAWCLYHPVGTSGAATK